MDDETLLTVNQVCAYLGITRSTWYRWRSIGHGPPTVPIGPPTAARKRIVRVRRADLMEFIGADHG